MCVIWLYQAAISRMRTAVFGRAGDRGNVPNVGILVSDGHSTVNASRTLPEAELAKRAGITMMTVVINTDHNLDNMTAIASNPRKDLFLLIDHSRLDSVVAQVIDRLLEIVL